MESDDMLMGGGKGTVKATVGVYSVCAWPYRYDHRPSHPYYAETEHVGFSPTRGRHCLHQARSVVRCSASRMKGELHPSSKNRARKTDLGTLCLFLACACAKMG